MTAVQKKTNNEYLKRVNRVLDYLDDHYSEAMNLEQLAQLANFSPYHFHRIFKSITGEPLNRYIQRIRLEKAAASLIYQPETPVSDIAFLCGFNASSAFSRAFKDHFAVSATQWRQGAYEEFSKNRKVNSKSDHSDSNRWQMSLLSSMYIDPSNHHSCWTISMQDKRNIKVEVRHMPDITVAYIRHIGEFIGETEKWAGLFQRLVTWASARDLIKCPETQFFTVFRDDLNITDFSKFKADVCLSLTEPVKPEGEIGISVIPEGKYATACFEIDGDEYEQAWDMIYREWLPESCYQPDERCCFERYLNDPNQHPENKHIIEIFIPVRPL